MGRYGQPPNSKNPAPRLTSIGTSYGEDDVFDLTKMEPYNLDKLYKSFTKYSKELVLYLPRNSDLNQIARYVPEGQKLEVAHYAIMAASKVCKLGLKRA
jgi:trimethylguanosine synthase